MPPVLRAVGARLRAALHPGTLIGIGFPQWLRVLGRNLRRLGRDDLGRVIGLTACSTFNSTVGAFERVRYGRRIRATPVPPPVFILGHWRSGTTFLHGLLAVDERFAYPSYREAFCPRTFLTTDLPVRTFMPSGGTRLTDNVEHDLDAPEEDAFALAALTGDAHYVGLAFRGDPVAARFLTLAGTTIRERRRWAAALIWFYKKLTYKYDGRPLILKSPGHTCRVSTLRHIFPDAKFVFIHRNPYDVIRSSMRVAGVWHGLDQPDLEVAVCNGIIAQYRLVHEVFEQQAADVPDGSLHRLSFEDLEERPLAEVERVYEALDLPDFEGVRPQLRTHLAALSGYEKTSHRDLRPQLREMVATELEPYFEQWGYSTEPLLAT